MNTSKRKLIIAIIVILLILLPGTFFTVQEGHSGLVLRLSQLVKNSKTNKVKVYQPGLHIKFPLIDQVKEFDTRIQTLDAPSSNVVTAEKKDVIVDYYVKWRISDLPLYYQRTGGDINTASKLLQQQVNANLRAEFGRRVIKEVVSDDRDMIMSNLNKKTNQGVNPLGMSVIDVRIKRIDFPKSISDAVYNNMRAEREQVAKELRSQGLAQAEAIRAEADAKVTVTIAQAQLDANTIRAKGDSEASQIYGDSYSKNPDFYAFLRSLQAYTETFNKRDDVLVLSPDSQFFRYFNNAGGEASSATTEQKK